MESRRNLRVLPSNAPSAPENENIHRPPSENLGLHASLQICPNFNNGIDCMVCGLLHACSTCLQEGHDARRCKKGILRVSSGNVGSSEPATHSNNCKSEPDVHYPFGVSRPLSKAPDYSTRNARKLEHRRRQRISDPLSKLPLTYRSELLSPRYNAYRAKARSKGPNQPWPDDLEEAFQEGMCQKGSLQSKR